MMMQVTYHDGVSPWCFTLVRDNVDLAAIESLLEEKHSEGLLSPLSNFTNGDAVCCCEGNTFFRALILKVHPGNRVKVFNIDKNISKFIRKENILTLTDDILDIPTRCMQCSLEDLNDEDKGLWSADLQEIFKSVLSEHRLFANIISTADLLPPKSIVQLFASNGDSLSIKVNLNQWILQKLLPDVKKIRESIGAEHELLTLLSEEATDPFHSIDTQESVSVLGKETPENQQNCGEKSQEIKVQIVNPEIPQTNLGQTQSSTQTKNYFTNLYERKYRAILSKFQTTYLGNEALTFETAGDSRNLDYNWGDFDMPSVFEGDEEPNALNNNSKSIIAKITRQVYLTEDSSDARVNIASNKSGNVNHQSQSSFANTIANPNSSNLHLEEDLSEKTIVDQNSSVYLVEDLSQSHNVNHQSQSNFADTVVNPNSSDLHLEEDLIQSANVNQQSQSKFADTVANPNSSDLHLEEDLSETANVNQQSQSKFADTIANPNSSDLHLEEDLFQSNFPCVNVNDQLQSKFSDTIANPNSSDLHLEEDLIQSNFPCDNVNHQSQSNFADTVANPNSSDLHLEEDLSQSSTLEYIAKMLEYDDNDVDVNHYFINNNCDHGHNKMDFNDYHHSDYNNCNNSEFNDDFHSDFNTRDDSNDTHLDGDLNQSDSRNLDYNWGDFDIPSVFEGDEEPNALNNNSKSIIAKITRQVYLTEDSSDARVNIASNKSGNVNHQSQSSFANTIANPNSSNLHLEEDLSESDNVNHQLQSNFAETIVDQNSSVYLEEDLSQSHNVNHQSQSNFADTVVNPNSSDLHLEEDLIQTVNVNQQSQSKFADTVANPNSSDLHLEEDLIQSNFPCVNVNDQLQSKFSDTIANPNSSDLHLEEDLIQSNFPCDNVNHQSQSNFADTVANPNSSDLHLEEDLSQSSTLEYIAKMLEYDDNDVDVNHYFINNNCDHGHNKMDFNDHHHSDYNNCNNSEFNDDFHSDFNTRDDSNDTHLDGDLNQSLLKSDVGSCSKDIEPNESIQDKNLNKNLNQGLLNSDIGSCTENIEPNESIQDKNLNKNLNKGLLNSDIGSCTENIEPNESIQDKNLNKNINQGLLKSDIGSCTKDIKPNKSIQDKNLNKNLNQGDNVAHQSQSSRKDTIVNRISNNPHSEKESPQSGLSSFTVRQSMSSNTTDNNMDSKSSDYSTLAFAVKMLEHDADKDIDEYQSTSIDDDSNNKSEFNNSKYSDCINDNGSDSNSGDESCDIDLDDVSERDLICHNEHDLIARFDIDDNEIIIELENYEEDFMYDEYLEETVRQYVQCWIDSSNFSPLDLPCDVCDAFFIKQSCGHSLCKENLIKCSISQIVHHVPEITMPAIGEYVSVKIIKVVSGSHFFAYLNHSNSDDLENLMNSLNNSAQTDNYIVKNICLGDLVLAKGSDELFRRGEIVRILKHQGQKQIEVSYHDFGFSEFVYESDLRRIDSKYLLLPFQAILMRLAYCTDNENKAKDHLASLILNQKLKALVKERYCVNASLGVRLYTEDKMNICLAMQESGFYRYTPQLNE